MFENLLVQNNAAKESGNEQFIDLQIEQLDCRVEMFLAAAGCCCCCCCHEGETGEPVV